MTADPATLAALIEAFIRRTDPQHANPAVWARRLADAILGESDVVLRVLGMHQVAMSDTACGWVVDHYVEEAGAWSTAPPMLEAI